jgi:glycosyltransferase involved in cell wall biosynthesis
MNKNVKLAIYALHPIMYQVGIFSILHNRINEGLGMESTVLFGDDLSLREVFFKETQVTFRPDTPNLLNGYKYTFLKNYAKDSRSGFFSRMNFGIFRELVKLRTDVLLVHGYESMTSWLAVFGAKLLGKKVIWRGEAVSRESQRWSKRWLKRILLGTFFKCCDAVMYSCSGNKSYLEGFGVSPSKMFFIPCAVDNKFFAEEFQRLSPQRDEIRSSLGIEKGDFVVLFCARFTERKRPIDLIVALAALNSPRMVALFVGDGPARKQMELSVKESNIRAHFAGFKNQSEVGRYYCISDAATVISAHDPSPKAMNEAMNFALPIIATDAVGTVPDLVRDGENGFVIEVGDVSALTNSLRKLVDDPQLTRCMGDCSQSLVADWNYEKDVDGILAAVDFTLQS